MNIETIASIVHTANKEYCQSIGDYSQPDWEFAPEWQKDSARKGVKFIIDNPDATPEDSHKSWLAQKEQDGWSYGPVKDVIGKKHPCFVPYNELPKEQKVKDYLFSSIVKTLSQFI